MNRTLVLILPIALATGSIVTLFSKFCKQNLSQRLGVCVTGYGFPLSWRSGKYEEEAQYVRINFRAFDTSFVLFLDEWKNL